MTGSARQTFRLSPQQRRLWRLQAPGETFTAQASVELAGPLDPDRLRRAILAVTEGQAALRTAFPRLPGMKVPDQEVGDGGEIEWRAIEADDAGAVRAAAEEAERRWDLAGGPPLRACLARLGPERHRLTLTLPSLCADVATLRLLVDRVASRYGTARDAPGGGEDGLQYPQVSDWLNSLLEDDDEDAREGRAYWRRHPAAGCRPSRLAGASRGASAAKGAVHTPVTLDGSSIGHLAEVAAKAGLAPADLVLAAWLAVAWRNIGDGVPILGCEHVGRAYDLLAGAFGPCSCTLPMAVPIEAERPFLELAAAVAGQRAEAAEWIEYYPAAEDEGGEAAFDLGFRWDELPPPVTAAGVEFRDVRFSCRSDRFEVELVAAGAGPALDLRLVHPSEGEAAARAEGLAAQLRRVLAAVATDPSIPVGRLPVVSAEELRALDEDLNGRRAGAPAETVVRLFVHRAGQVPDRIAVAAGDRGLSYRELDRRSARLAAELRRRRVGPEVRVGLSAERRPETVIAILAVLRAGGAYVPVDPGLPAARQAMLLVESGARLWLAPGGSPAPGGLGLPALDPVGEGLPDADAFPDSEGPPATPESLAYVLFTSGSTGGPKPVGVEHRQLAGYVRAILGELALEDHDAGFAMVSTFGADLGHTALFPSLCSGGRLHLVSQDGASSPAALEDEFLRWPPDVVKIVPSHLRALLSGGSGASLLPRKRLVLGGEALRWDLVDTARALAPECRVINHYGPTETTVGASLCHVERVERAPDADGVPIGRALANGRLAVVGPDLRPVPAEAPGELVIGGSGVARGYLGRPRETAVRFLPDPFGPGPGARLYRTGDRVRYLPGAGLEFRGRLDHQVKVHGYRLEPQEVEAVLVAHPGVREAAVTLRQDDSGRQHLVAYIVARKQAPEASELRVHLQERLPEYMIPAGFVALDALPLTANGKVDRSALPEPGRLSGNRPPYEPPRDAVEGTLAEVWQEVLGVEPVGVHDDFLQLGGDSILAIRVVALANQKGIRVLPRQIFQHPTVAELAAVAAPVKPTVAEQGPVIGPVELTPIQRSFLDADPAAPHHFNQALLLTVQRRLEADVLARALARLVEHHDALRLRFRPTSGGWRQDCAPPDGEAPLEVFDLSEVPAGERRPRVTELAGALQRSLDLERGPLLRAALFELAAGEPQRLLLVAHHLVVDGVSWRLLLEDLERVYEQLQRREEPALPPKTTSFQRWAEWLQELAGSDEIAGEIPFWTGLAGSELGSLPTRAPGSGSSASERQHRVSLGERETRAILEEVTAVQRAEVVHLLLAALARALSRATGAPQVLVEMEDHGRIDGVEGIDLSRTVGWFTALYPLAFDLSGTGGVHDAVAVVKERLRQVPRRGVGYGLLRYLRDDPAVREALLAQPAPQVTFNYLGRLDRALAADSPFEIATEYAGRTRSPEAKRRRPLSVQASVSEGRLHVHWVYAADVLEERDVAGMAESMLEELRALAQPARKAPGALLTPDDFPEAEISAADLESVLSQLKEGAEEVSG